MKKPPILQAPKGFKPYAFGFLIGRHGREIGRRRSDGGRDRMERWIYLMGGAGVLNEVEV